MSDPQAQLLEETFSDVLQTLAFISPLPPEGPPVPPADAVLVRIEFSGGASGGAIELVAGQSFGNLLVSNLLAVEPADPTSGEQAVAAAAAAAADALKELMNVVCGRVLSRLIEAGANGGGAGDERRQFRLGIPQIEHFATDRDWSTFVADGSSHVFDAEGNTLAVRINRNV